MSIQPIPSRLLTAAEYLELAEPDNGYSELVEGRYVMSPSPRPKHYKACRRLATALEPHLPPGYEILEDIDVDLRLVPPAGTGTVRRPDLMVVRSEAIARVDRDGGFIGAEDVLLVVEIVSPGSVRTDHIVKRAEYADAGIPHYWIVDLGDPVSLIACHLAGAFGYVDGGVTTGVFTTAEPFPVTIDLDALI